MSWLKLFSNLYHSWNRMSIILEYFIQFMNYQAKRYVNDLFLYIKWIVQNVLLLIMFGKYAYWYISNCSSSNDICQNVIIFAEKIAIYWSWVHIERDKPDTMQNSLRKISIKTHASTIIALNCAKECKFVM